MLSVMILRCPSSSGVNRMNVLRIVIHVCIIAGCRVDGHFVKPDSFDGNNMDAMQGQWGRPERVLNVNTPESNERDPSVTADHLELYFYRSYQGTGGIFVASRLSPESPWGIPAPVWTTSELRGSFPEVSPDGLELYFNNGTIINRSVRLSRTAAWGAPTELFFGGPVALTGDALTMYHTSYDTNPSYQIRKRTRTSIGAAWRPEEPVAGIDPSSRYNSISVDKHDLYIVLSGPVELGIPKVAEMSRASISEPFQGLQELPTLTTPRPEHEECDMFGADDAMYCHHSDDFVSQDDIFFVRRQL